MTAVNKHVVGCTACAAPNLTVTVRNCAGNNEAGATVTVRTRVAPVVTVYTGITDANGQITATIPQGSYELVVNAAEYDSSITFSIGFTSVSYIIDHPGCGWPIKWGPLYVTDPWGVLPLVTPSGASTVFPMVASHQVACRGIAAPKDFDPNFPNECSRATVSDIQATVMHELTCLVSSFPVTTKLIRLYSFTYQCGVQGVDPNQPGYSTPVYFGNPDILVTETQWGTGGLGSFGNMRRGLIALSELPLCAQDARNPPDLEFGGMNYSVVGGPSAFTNLVSI
jgi:hypothetical protein